MQLNVQLKFFLSIPQKFYLFNGSLMNGVLNDGLLGTDDEVGRVDGLAEDVGGAAGVGASVLSVDVNVFVEVVVTI